MQYSNSTYRQGSRWSRPSTASLESSAIPERMLMFWLPVLMILGAIWVSHYRSHFALSAAGISADKQEEVEAVGETTKTRQILFPFLGLMGGVLFLRQRKKPMRVDNLLAIAATSLFLWVMASITWSEVPGTSFRRLIIIFLVAIAAVGIGRAWTPIDLCRASMITSGVLVFVSVLLEVKAGTFMSGGEYRFSGAFHPNRQAVCCGIFALSSLSYFRYRRSFLYLGAAALGLVLTKLTGSRGGLLALLSAIAMTYFLTMSIRGRVLTVMAGVMLIAVGLIGLGASSKRIPRFNDLSKLGRNDDAAQGSTLTGRIPIWEECVTAIAAAPLNGYGYGAFWTPKRVQDYFYIHNWAFSNAHSVYLETALDIGIAGLMLAISVVTLAFSRAYRFWKLKGDYGAVFIMGLFCAGAVHGLVEAVYVTVGLASIMAGIGIAIMAMHRPERAMA